MGDLTLSEALPDESARALYRAILREGGRVRAAEVGLGDLPTMERLVELGLVMFQDLDVSYIAVDPRSAVDRIGTEIRLASARLLAEAEQVPDLLGDLTRAYDASPHRVTRAAGVRYVTGMEQIRQEIEQVAREYPKESLTAIPGGARPAAALPGALAQTRDYIERGGVKRVIYDPAARLDGPTVGFAAEAARLGCPIRVLAAPFTRLMLFDRTVAVIPAAGDNTSAAFVEDPATVAFLVEVFEQQWQQAEGVNWAALAAGSSDSTVHEQVGRLLAQGLTQRAIASRMGLSERTVAGHIARLRELYDAETLFQLGWQMRGSRTGESGG
ncbi:LuxR C-terminal-related transcriptional regulator [Kitasatospora sp. NPDC048722]|uniref:LuxR C-terminal-related transcriptional regulator n=1 Tax=Kitasatospora sp. NPDC048722 TaxID=3155639 RepID=UPI00340EFD7C